MRYFDFFPGWQHYQSKLDQVVRHVRNAPFVLAIGNGGSETIASHLTVDLSIAGIECHSLSSPSILTAFSNDFGYENVYSRQIVNYDNGGLLIAISSSGNSSNIIDAINISRTKDFSVVTYSGFDPHNAISKLGDVNIHVSSHDYGVVETAHMILVHYVINVLRGFENEME